MKKLTNEVKRHCVMALAVYTAPSMVQRELKATFGVDVSVSTIVGYDPGTAQGASLSVRWRELFEKTREAFVAQCSRVPIMHRYYRMMVLQRILDKEEERGNTVGMREVLKQAAEEMGNAYSNKREVTGADGSPIAMSMTVDFVEATWNKFVDRGDRIRSTNESGAEASSERLALAVAS